MRYEPKCVLAKSHESLKAYAILKLKMMMNQGVKKNGFQRPDGFV